MKILILSWRGPGHPNAGGAEQVTLEHAKSWVGAGHNVTLFTSFFRGARKDEIIEGIKVIRDGSPEFGVKFKAFWWYLFGNHPKFDLVVDEFHGIPFFTPLYVRAKKLAFIHEVAKEVWWLNPWPKPFNLIPGVIGTLFEPLMFKLFYKNISFMTVSESTRDDLVSWGIDPKRIKVIHNGVNLKSAPKKLSLKEKKKTAMFLGAISRDKGIEDALKVFSEISKVDSSWQFWVVGKASPEMKNLLINEIKRLGIEEKVKYFGFVNDKKKFELLSKTLVLVNTSIHEGWGLVNIEANSVGTPVVGYNVQGVRDSVKNGKTGLLIQKGNYQRLVSKVKELSDNVDEYNRFQNACVNWSKNFSWGNAVKQSQELIENLD